MGKIAGLVDQRQILEAVRDRLAAFLDGDIGHKRSCECECGVPPDLRTIPATARELRDVVRDIADMPVTGGVSELDELTAARKARHEAARLAAATDAQRPAVRAKRGARSGPLGGDSRTGA